MPTSETGSASFFSAKRREGLLFDREFVEVGEKVYL